MSDNGNLGGSERCAIKEQRMSGRVNLARLYTLLVVWIALLVAPAVLEVLGTFGHFDMNSSIGGAISAFGSWDISHSSASSCGYRESSIRGFLAWFAASLLPWAIDWTTPVSPILTCVWVAIAILFALWIAAHGRREESLREHGVHATAPCSKSISRS